MNDPHNPYAWREPAIDPNNPFASPRAEESFQDRAIHRADELLNPWFSMWLRPRATIRQIVETDPKKYVVALAALSYMGQVVNVRSLPDDMDFPYRMGVVVGQMLFGAAIGLVALFLMGWLIKVSARWLGGRGSVQETRAAFAWSGIPSIWFLPVIMVLNAWWAIAPPDPLQNVSSWHLAVLISNVIVFFLFFYEVVLLSQSVGEVHQISGWSGFAACFLACVIFFCSLFAIAIPLIFVVVALQA